MIASIAPPLCPLLWSFQRPSPTLQVSPAFLMYFLQAELTMNECARRRKWVEHARQQNARDEKFLSQAH